MAASFAVSKEDALKILAAARRASELLKLDTEQALTVHMSVTAAHANGCPLDLDRLVAASDSDLIHDVLGLDRHVSRRTGRVDPARFWPRFAVPS